MPWRASLQIYPRLRGLGGYTAPGRTSWNGYAFGLILNVTPHRIFVHVKTITLFAICPLDRSPCSREPERDSSFRGFFPGRDLDLPLAENTVLSAIRDVTHRIFRSAGPFKTIPFAQNEIGGTRKSHRVERPIPADISPGGRGKRGWQPNASEFH